MPFIPEGGVATGRGNTGDASIDLFKLGEDYAKGTAVIYEAGWYEARVDITEADEVPPLDPDRWEEFYAHGIESHGAHLEDDLGVARFNFATLVADGQEGGIGFESAALDSSAIEAQHSLSLIHI